MSKQFFTPDLSDKRITFASGYLQDMGYIQSKNAGSADFVLLGINPKGNMINQSIPCFAGNISANNVYDYTKNEVFALKNAALTAEGAIDIAISNSDISLINSKVLIAGYGRIGKALHRYLMPFTSNITVCARNDNALCMAEINGAKTIGFSDLKNNNGYSFIFNTVPHPVFNEAELAALKKEAVLIDLASFPGGVDVHFSKHMGINLIVARGLPAKCSPKSAGKVVAETVDIMVREVFA